MKKLNLYLFLAIIFVSLTISSSFAQSLEGAIIKLWTNGPDESIEKVLTAAALGKSPDSERAAFHLSCFQILSGAENSAEILANLEQKARTDDEKETIARLKERLNKKSKALPESFQNKISLDFKDIDLREILPLIAKQSQTNIVLHSSVKKKVTLRLIDATIEQALDTICAITDLNYENRNGVFVLLPEKKPTSNYVRSTYRMTSMSPSRAVSFLKANSGNDSDQNAPANFPEKSGQGAAGSLPLGVSLSSEQDKVILEGPKEAVEQYVASLKRFDLKERAHKLSFRIWQVNADNNHDIEEFSKLSEQERNLVAKIISAPAIVCLPGQPATIEVNSSSPDDAKNHSNSLDFKIETVFTDTKSPDQLRITNEFHIFFGTSSINGKKLETNRKFSNTIQIVRKKWVLLPIFEDGAKFYLELMIDKAS